MLTGLMFLIVFIVVAMMWTEGLWSNAITFVTTLFAACIALNWFEPLADFFESKAPSYTYLWDSLALWLIFFLAHNILRIVTDNLSKHKVRFKMPVEMAGRAVFALATAWLMVSLMHVTMHVAPMARTAVKGGFQEEPKSGNFLGLSPGRKMLAFMQSRSRGALSSGAETTTSRYSEDKGKNVFDPNSEFVLKYGQRRADFQEHNKKTGAMRVDRKK